MFAQVTQLGPNHPDVATTMANTAGLLKAKGKLAEAETVYRTVSSTLCLLMWASHRVIAPGKASGARAVYLCLARWQLYFQGHARSLILLRCCLTLA